MKKVFLAGTLDGFDWRKKMIEQLEIEWFNPIVEEITLETQAEEQKQKQVSDYVLYYIAPSANNYLAVAEAIDDSIRRPASTIFYIQDNSESCIQFHKYHPETYKDLQTIGKRVQLNGGQYFRGRNELLRFLNSWNNAEPDIDYDVDTTTFYEHDNNIVSNLSEEKDIKETLK